MEVIQSTHFDFLGKRHFWVGLSLVLLAFSFYAWFEKGDEKYGVDFRGGNEFVVQFEQETKIDALRSSLERGGYPEATVQRFEKASNEFSVRLGGAEDKETSRKVRAIFAALGNHKILKEDFVGPVIGKQIRDDAVMAGILSLIGIMIYVTVRFDWRFAVGAVVALFHDAIIAAGATVFMGKEIGAPTLAAILTIIGYSVNDTIIIYDRIRENLVSAYKTGGAGKKGDGGKLSKMTLMEIMNASVNQTLSRTIITSLTVYFVCLTLWLLGSGTVSDLAFTLFVGVVVGTYSSVFIACPWVLAFEGKGFSEKK